MAAGQLTGGAMTMRMHAAPLALATLLVSGVADGWRAVALTRAARHTHSPTVAAAALNFRLDVLTTAVAIVGLTTVGTGYQIADPIAALLIGVVMLASAVRLTWHTLRDRPATA
jgi:divalent metal cation (Fe/Co/Zn/Cd) transporter